MEKNSKLFKKIGDTKGNFHTKMGTIKDRNSKGLTDTEEIKKRWLKYAEKLCQKILNDLDNHNVYSQTSWSVRSSGLCKASSDSCFALLYLFFFRMVLVTASHPMLGTSDHSSSGTLFTRSNPLNLVVSSTA